MKKVFFGLFSLFLFVGTANAQDPAKALKKVRGLLSDYNINQVDNSSKLDEAKEMVDLAMSDATVASTYKAWAMKGKVYNELAGRDVMNLQLDPAYKLSNTSAGIDAAEAFATAYEKAEKKYEKKEAIEGMQTSATHLDVIGRTLAEAKNYEDAYNCFNKVISVSDKLKANGVKSLLATEDDENEYNFFAGYFAYHGGNKAATKSIFSKLIEKDYDQALIYSTMFNILNEEGDAGAIDILEKGRAKYPENKEILFAEINHYIQKQDYNALKDKLAAAIEQAPDNPSVYSAMGNVYMNLFQEAYGAGKTAEATAHFDESKKYYEQALKINPELFDVQYSLGSLYYNKGVEITKVMNDLPVSETKKYDMLKKEAIDLFNVALPYFKAAEKLNANDTNTLIALKEIFARNDDFEKSNEFKKRLETVQAGGKNDASYFK